MDKAKGTLRSINKFAEDSGISAAHISRLLRELLDTPPSPDTIKKFTSVAHNSITYEDLMKAAGHIPIDASVDHLPEKTDMKNSSIAEEIQQIKSWIEKNQEYLDLMKKIKDNNIDINIVNAFIDGLIYKK